MITTSYDLMQNGSFPLSSPYYDKVFLLVEVIEESSGSLLFIINRDSPPAVRMDETVDLSIPTVVEINQGGKYHLISSNVMLKIADVGYPLLFRDEKAQFYPNSYTCFAGRCEQTPMSTALAELNEEMAIFVRNKPTCEVRLLGFGSADDACRGKLHKEKYMNLELPDLLVLPVFWRKGRDFYRMKLCDELIEENSATIIKDNNTFEICFEAEVSLPEGWELHKVSDAEGYGRITSIVSSLKDLRDKPCVPALAHFVENRDIE